MKSIFFIISLFFNYFLFSQNNYVLNFNGINSYVDLGSNVSDSVVSVEFWFKPSISIDQNINEPIALLIRNTGTNEVGEFGFYIGPNDISWPNEAGKICFYKNINGTRYISKSNNNFWDNNHWYHVAGVIEAGVGMKLYIDGELQNDINSNDDVAMESDDITAIGKWGDQDIRYFYGKIDELRFWNKSISEEEINQKMCSIPDVSNETALVAYYKFDEGSGEVLEDEKFINNGIINTSFYSVENFCSSNSIINSEINSTLIFPNPYSENTILTTFDKNITYVKIFSANGQYIGKYEINTQIQKLNPGCYFLNFFDSNDQLLRIEKIIFE